MYKNVDPKSDYVDIMIETKRGELLKRAYIWDTWVPQ